MNFEEMTLEELLEHYDEYIAFLQTCIDFMKCRKALGNPVTEEQARKVIQAMINSV
jgi:hypothetical protein